MQISVNPPLPILRMGLSWYLITQEGRRLTLGVRRLCVQGCWAELRVVKKGERPDPLPLDNQVTLKKDRLPLGRRKELLWAGWGYHPCGIAQAVCPHRDESNGCS